MATDFTPQRSPTSGPPLAHRLGAGEVCGGFVRGGAQLYVAQGEMRLVAAPRVLGGQVHYPSSALVAGHSYRIDEAGWIELRAHRAAMFLWLAPAEVSAASRIKGILSAWLGSWRRRPGRPVPAAAPAPSPQGPRSPRSPRSRQSIQGANT